MTRSQAPRSSCPIAIALDIFGDRWSLLIARDLLFNGAKTFKDFRCAEEGIATNVLAERLERLADNGIIEAKPDPGDARRRFYRLTEKGRQLAPVLVEIVRWSAKHHKTAAPPEVVAAIETDRDAFVSGVLTALDAVDEAAPSSH